MGLTGNLRTMLFADLLQWLSLGQKTGTLLVSSDAIEKRIFFKGGKVIASASSDPREYLSEFLMSEGYVTYEQLQNVIEAQLPSKMLLGKILVMIDSISEKDLLRLMRRKAEEEMYDIFLWTEGSFQFVDDDLPTLEMVPLQIDLTGVLMEGTRRLDEWNRIRHLIPDKAMIPVIEKPIDHSGFSEAQKLILQCVNGHRNIEQIMVESHTTHFLVATTLAEVVSAGAVRFHTESVTVAAAPPAAAAEELPEPSAEMSESEASDEVSSLVTRAQSALRAGEFEKSLRLLRAAQNLDPENSNVRSSIKGAETVISSELKKAGISLSRVPRMTKPLDEITDLDITPNEGFLISRINGIWDVGSIIKISPMRESEALLIFHRLHNDGIIDFAK
ncbi:MAG TPA: DUF4388 domain-containing protein [Thermoanaerobaculia bacterium]|nr:DUF4388 domain-containing protein [Thermoanaerobaculia bacterium]